MRFGRVRKRPIQTGIFRIGFFVDYFTHVPLWFQRVTTPVNSIYAACAGIKLLIHILFVYLLAAFISGSGSLLKVKVLATMAVLTVFFKLTGTTITWESLTKPPLTISFMPCLCCSCFSFISVLYADWLGKAGAFFSHKKGIALNYTPHLAL